MSAGPVAIVVTYRRPAELARLLSAFAQGDLPPTHVIVADNAASQETRSQRTGLPFEVSWLPLPENPGPGAAWKAGAEAARAAGLLEDGGWVLFCDDDIIPGRSLLADAAQTLASDSWELAAPLLSDEEGNLWGFPEPAAKSLRRVIRKAKTPAHALELLGHGPHKLCWATGACVFVTAKALARYGLHRTDFYMLGEDLEFAMRVASGGRAVFYPEWHVPHWPFPRELSSEAARLAEKRKFLSLLQNLAYLAFHSPHSAHMRWYLPGNCRRYLRTFGLRAESLREVFACLWNGCILGEPSGRPSGERLRAKFAAGRGGER